MTTVTDSLFVVNSNAEIFTTWIVVTIQRDQERCWEAWTVRRNSGREYQVTGVRRRRTDDGSLCVQVRGTDTIPKKNDPTTDWLYFIDALVEFRVLPLSAERCEVSARWHSGGGRCAEDMLARIGQRWPEAAIETRGEPGTPADTAGAVSLPTRPVDQRRWRATWNRIADRVADGQSPAQIAAFLERAPAADHLSKAVRTLTKIIRAGEAGAFDEPAQLPRTSPNLR